MILSSIAFFSLLENKDPNIADFAGIAPLHWAGDAECARILLEVGLIFMHSCVLPDSLIGRRQRLMLIWHR